jgi:hypothetical protein
MPNVPVEVLSFTVFMGISFFHTFSVPKILTTTIYPSTFLKAQFSSANVLNFNDNFPFVSAVQLPTAITPCPNHHDHLLTDWTVCVNTKKNHKQFLM